MFERYSESARRALFFARYEASQLGGLTIEPEHLVLGALRDAPALVVQLVGGPASAATIRQRLAEAVSGQQKVPTNAEIPFSHDAKAVLERTPIEADDLKRHWITPAHILLGVMVKTNGAAARILHDAGVDVDAIRDRLRGAAEDSGDRPAAESSQLRGLVARQWTGVAKPGLEDDYVRHLQQVTFPALERLPGFVRAGILRRDVGDGTEFQVVTVWRSLEAIEAFAGSDVTRAVVPPEAQTLLLRYDDRAVHYDIVQ